MKGKILWRDDVGKWEWICEHGIGHYHYGGVHGCDGCCTQLTDAENEEIDDAIQDELIKNPLRNRLRRFRNERD